MGVLHLLRLVTWPYLRRHSARTLLTALGVALGVTVFVAVHSANDAVLASLTRTIDRIAGRASLQVTAGDAGFPEEVLERVQAVDAVNVAVPAIEAVVASPFAGQGPLLVLGVDMTGDRSLRDYDVEADDAVEIDDPLVFLAQPDSLMVSREYAVRNGIRVGTALQLSTALGLRQFIVRGLMRTSDLASAFDGNIAVMDIYAAQRMFGRGRTFDRIDVSLDAGVMVADGQAALTRALGEAFEVRTPAGRGQQFESMLAGYTTMMTVASGFALFIGLFMIYNAFTLAVAERRREIGVLRALGASSMQVQALFLAEGALLGAAGSAMGAASGVGIARATAAWLAGVVANVYGIAPASESLTPQPATIGAALALGTATSLLAALIPARSAGLVRTVDVLRGNASYQRLPSTERRVRASAGAAAALLGAVLTIAPPTRGAFYLGYTSVLAAAVLLGPFCIVALSRAARGLLGAVRPVEGTLAADSLIQSPRRTSGSVVPLMLSVALVVSFSGMSRSSYRSIMSWVDTTLDPDLFVLPTQSLDVQSTRFPGRMAGELAAIDGVVRVQPVRNVRVRFRDSGAMLVAIDAASAAETAHLPPIEGDETSMYRQTARGEGVLVADALAQMHDLHVGDLVEVPAPFGTLRLPVVGVVTDYSDQQGSVIVDVSTFATYWHDDTVNMFRVYVADRSSIPDVRRSILDRYSAERQVFALTNGQVRAYVSGLAGQWFRLTSAQVWIAVIVAMLGILNTLTVSIADRQKDFSVLRALGAGRGQVMTAVWLEAMTIAAIGLVLGVLLGAVNLRLVLDMVRHDVAGLRLDYALPWAALPMLTAAILGSALLAAVLPIRLALGRAVTTSLAQD